MSPTLDMMSSKLFRFIRWKGAARLLPRNSVGLALVAVVLLAVSDAASSTSTTTGRRRTRITKVKMEQVVTDEHEEVLNSSLSSANDSAGLNGADGTSTANGYWLEIKAIIGGVLGFWGGVVGLGAVFLVVVLSQRYCCKKPEDDKNDGNG